MGGGGVELWRRGATFWEVVGEAGTGRDHTRCCLWGGCEDHELPVDPLVVVVVVVVM